MTAAGFAWRLHRGAKIAAHTCALLSLALGAILMTGCGGTGSIAPSNVVAKSTGTASLTVSPASLAFGNVTVGTSSTKVLSLSNPGNADVTISSITFTGANFSGSGLVFPAVIPAGGSSSFNVTYKPSATGSVSNSLSIVSNSSTAVPDVALTGTGVTGAVSTATIDVSPTTITFPNTPVNSSSNQTLMITNSGTATLSVTAANVVGSGFSVTGVSFPFNVSPGQSTNLLVVFTPTSVAGYTGSVTMASNASNAAPIVALSGTGTTAVAAGNLTVSPATLSFNTVLVGSSASLPVTLTNSNATALSIYSVTPSGAGFSVSGITTPYTLAANSSKTFTVTFTPQAGGASSGSVSIASSAANSPNVVSVSGAGQVPIQHTVTLSWFASTSVVSGYRIYRSTVSGGPYTAVNSVLQAGTSYVDSTVQSGVTYYYVVRAVDSTGSESANSNEATAPIPTP